MTLTSTIFKESQPLKKNLNLASYCLAIVVGLVSSSACAESFTGGQPISPQPASASMKPGLAVDYFFDYFGHIDSLSILTEGSEGEPLANLAHRTKTGDVLTADRPMGVGAKIRGMIHLAQTGVYTFKVESNDGVRLHIGGIKLWTDPEIHSNRWSRPLEYEVTEAGWYDFKIDYYQRKGTSALQLTWVPPAGSEETVPAEAFSH